MDNNYYQQFACCVPVKGYLRSMVYDLQRKDYWFVPNDLYAVLTEEKRKPIQEIKEKYPDHDIEGYFEFLFENEICFPCNKEDLELFPELDKQWHIPFEFENCIIDFRSGQVSYLSKIVSEVSDFAIPNVQLRFYQAVEEDQLEQIIRAFYESKIKFLEIIVPNNFTNWFIDELIRKTPKIRLIVLTSSGKRQRRDVEQSTVFETPQVVDSPRLCGVIQQEQFVCEMRTFCESTQFNSCLNCKISIDIEGNIKNCPSMKQSFGTISNTSIAEAIQHPDFKKLWFLSKDKIEVCRECEFRHMCTDCRAYRKQPDNLYSQPEKCFYNPYIAKWRGEDGYIPVEACGNYNDKGKFTVDKAKVDRLNLQLWEE